MLRVESWRAISERGFGVLLEQALAARAEGVVVLRDREALRHGVWVQEGYVVGVHVAGRFDPLLELLRGGGSLDPRAHRRCVARLGEVGVRSGSLASALAGVEHAVVIDALRQQMAARFAVLCEIAAQHGFDAALERRTVAAEDISVRMPLGSILRRACARAAPTTDERSAARRHLRGLAKALHPDRHPELDAQARLRLTHALARATAAYHGLA